jgi:DNA-3-methyladenine glycosylase
MFGPSGRLYVYRSYGVHWCMNVVVGEEGRAAAVLLRGGLPRIGLLEMTRRRGRNDHISDGPGKLCQALGVTGEHDGTDLTGGGAIRLEAGEPPGSIECTARVGISKATDRPWRFVAAG